jgi:2'-5' RNA ligase
LETRERARYALMLCLPRRVEVLIEDAFLRLAGSTRPAVGYHITLWGPFTLAEGVEGADLVAAVAVVGARWQPLRIHLEGLGAFRKPNDNVVYMRLRDPEELAALHHALLDALAGTFAVDERSASWTGARYSPHVTLGIGLSDAETDEFLRSATARAFAAEFEAFAIWLVRQQPSGPWENLAGLPLGAPRQAEDTTLDQDLRATAEE